jgi:hypothetical protein
MKRIINIIQNNFFWIVWGVATIILSWFIVKNAQWLIGDDAIVIKKTGSGIPFSISDTILPESGRFYPMAYYGYNILLLFNKTIVSVQQHYILISIAFLIFSLLVFKLSREVTTKYCKSKLLVDVIGLLFTFVILQRSYVTFSHLFSTIWIDYLLLMVFIYYAFKFLTTKKTIYGLISFVAILYCVFCIETIFIIPATSGILFLIVGKYNKSKSQIVFGASLLLLAIIYLVMYYFIVYRFTISAYDGSHGADTTFIQNAINMLLNQKLLIVSLLLLLIRLYMIIAKKDNYDIFYDTFLLTGLAFALGCFILGLNWGMYYMISVLFVGFPILYNLTKLLKTKYALLIVVLLSLFYIRNFPKNIQTVQKSRLETKALVNELRKYYELNYAFIWRDEVLFDQEWDKVMSQFKHESLTTLLKHEFDLQDFEFNDKTDKTQYLCFYPDEYRKISWDNTLKILTEKSGIIIVIND